MLDPQSIPAEAFSEFEASEFWNRSLTEDLERADSLGYSRAEVYARHFVAKTLRKN